MRSSYGTATKAATTAAAAVAAATALAVLLSQGVDAAQPRYSPEIEARIARFEKSLQPGIVIAGDRSVQGWSLEDRLRHYRVPGVSVAVIRKGQLAWARGYGSKVAGKAAAVDADTVFSVGSLSKVVTAAIVLRLVDAGRIGLDRDVNAYLSRWKLPQNEFTAKTPVTLRGILSHTAGLTVHGFGDFLPGEKLPTILDTLEGRLPARNEAVRVDYLPGSEWRYSGGGTTVAQLIVEETAGAGFAETASRLIFEPLGMKRSTFENPLPAAFGNIAQAHDEEGRRTALPRGWQTFPEMAASGLWTTPSDYAHLMMALMSAHRGTANEFLSPEIARAMMTEVGPSRFGLGPMLDGRGAARRFSHDGANDSYIAWMEGWLDSADGLVVFTNGAQGSELFREIRRAVALSEGWAPSAPLQSSPLSPRELSDHVGTYEVSSPHTLSAKRLGEFEARYKVRLEGDHLYFGAPESNGVALTAVERDRFVGYNAFFDYIGDRIELVFGRGYDGRVDGMTIHYGDLSLESRRLPGT